MKLRNLILGAFSAVALFAACQEEEANLGTPDISISTNELTFDVDGGEQALTLNATRDWKVETDADWVVVDPAKGEASADDQTVVVTVLENTGMDRSADLKFTIGMKSKYLTVSQAGPGGSAEALIVYSNDFDKVAAVKDGNYWPYPDQSDCWQNQTGSGSANVGFGAKNITVRNNSNSKEYSNASGVNNIFFGKSGNYFMVSEIEMPSSKDFTLSFGTIRNLFDATDNTFVNSEFHVWISNDGEKWVEVQYAFAGGPKNGAWDMATSSFSLSSTVSKLYIAFTSDIESSHRIDDLSLVMSSEVGTLVDFSTGVAKDFGAGSNSNPGTGDLPEGTGEGTEASPYDAAKATKLASALGQDAKITGVYVKGIVKSIKEVSTQYGNATYYITDADGAANFYVYRGKNVDNTSFTSADQINVGDNVVIYGDLMNYMGNSPQLGQGNYLVSINGGGDNPGSGDNPGDNTPVDEPTSLVKATIAEFLAAAEDDTWYELTGEIVSIEAGNAYGNFTIKDATGEVYIYGMTSKWVGSNDKSFASLGLKETDIVTLGTLRGSYNGQAQGGGSVVPAYYISHVPGAGLPEDPSGTVELTFSADTQESVGSYTSDWSATIGTNSWRIVNFNNNNNKWSYIKCGHKATSNTATITTKNALAGTITSVVVQVDKIIDASKCTTKLEVASDASFSNIEETVNVTIAQGAVNYTLTTPRANCYYRLVFDCVGLGGDTNGNVQISKVKYLAAE